MTVDFWNSIQHFNAKEFDSPDRAGSGFDNMNETLIRGLNYVRQQMEQPLRVNSGYRTKEHNKEVGGVVGSQHTLGKAADIHIDDQEMGDKIAYWFKDYLGEDVGIGRYNTFIHIDVRGHKAEWDNRG